MSEASALLNYAVPSVEQSVVGVAGRVDAVAEIIEAIDVSIEPIQQSLDRVLPDLLRIVEVVDGKVQTIGADVSELSEALMVALRLIPGVRKSSRSA